ncbi:MAG: F-type H+-transporting ATPase subunit b [Patescibacteria group bacterium]|nr:F-type H+-transporting ATPase subunit b [Patescibacteria group bacterium]
MIGEVLGKLGFDWKVALANLVNFLIIYYLLRNVVFKKLGAAIKERQERIQKGLDDAKRAESALVMAEVEKDSILKDAHKESKVILEDADKKGKKIVSDAKTLAGEEASKIKDSALKDIDKTKEQTRKELEKEYVSLVLDGIEKVAKGEIDKNKSQKLAESLLK